VDVGGLASSVGTLERGKRLPVVVLGIHTLLLSPTNNSSTGATAMACCSPVMAQTQTQTKERHTAIAIIEATACIRARRIRRSRMRGAVSPILTARLLSSSSPTPLVDVRACSLTNFSDIDCLLSTRRIAFSVLRSIPTAILTPCSHLKPTAHATRSTTL
jgi:hypothetical protein